MRHRPQLCRRRAADRSSDATSAGAIDGRTGTMSLPREMVSSTAPRLGRNWSLPNILTYARVAAVPLVAGFLFWPQVPWARWTALAIFIAAGISDFFDGYLARAWSQQSSLGRMLDPIADKLLVAAVILVLAANQTISGLTLSAAIVILCREILVSGLREHLAELRVPLPVTALAKWKTVGSVHRSRLPDRRPGGRSRAAGRRHDRYCPLMDRRPRYALHRLGLYEGELRPRWGRLDRT